MIRVQLPTHFKRLAGVDGEVRVAVTGPVTIGSVMDALEAAYPMLKGTVRDHGTLRRRAFVRYFTCKEDWSHEATDRLLPAAVAEGKELFMVVGSLSGG